MTTVTKTTKPTAATTTRLYKTNRDLGGSRKRQRRPHLRHAAGVGRAGVPGRVAVAAGVAGPRAPGGVAVTHAPPAHTPGGTARGGGLKKNKP